MTTYATYQGIPILIEVHVLPHSDGATYGILFAKAGTDTDDVIGFVTYHRQQPPIRNRGLVPDATDVL